MQGFVYAAKTQFSEIMWRLGERETARRLFHEAEELKKRFNDKFWMEDEGFFGLAIDAKGELVRSVASDPGQCLFGGIVDEDKRKLVADRLMKEDLFSGWGVRTLSADHPAYNPFSYHRGTVWPVTAANFVLAFGRYGFHQEMHQLSKGMFEAADLFEHGRLPEVFGGHQRSSETPFPGLYTRADWPQAWSASAPLAMMQAMLGIYPYAPAGLLFLDPHLPEWLPEISIERMHVGNAVVSLRFWRKADGETDYSIIDLEGELDVVRHPSPWQHISGWAEHIDDFVSGFAVHRR
jgi:glycogen debranching enzyme